MSVDISVITPTFRRPDKLVEAVKSALAQQGVSVEVIVLDDSPEGSAQTAIESIGDPRIRYFQQSQPSGGRPAVVRNDGYRMARGRFVHFLDDDDHVADGAYTEVVQTFDKNPSTGVVYGWVVPFGDDPAALKNKTDYFRSAAQIAKQTTSRYRTVATILFRGTLMVNSACLIRRECIEPLGGFDPTIQVYEDVDFWMRGIRKFGHIFLDRPILEYRTGASSLMHDLQGDWHPVADSYKIIHSKYKAEHGMFEYAALKLLSFSIPTVAPAST